MQGIYIKGGLVFDFEGEQDNKDEIEWRDDSIAASCIIKQRKISSTTFFTKGKLAEIGYFLKSNKEINAVFINTTLTSMQQKKLEKRFNDYVQDREHRVRRYFIKSVEK